MYVIPLLTTQESHMRYDIHCIGFRRVISQQPTQESLWTMIDLLSGCSLLVATLLQLFFAKDQFFQLVVADLGRC